MLPRSLIIAIDGPSGAGKGTVARWLAGHLGYRHEDTCAMYRAVAWLAKQKGVDLADAGAVAEIARLATIDLERGVSIDGHDVTQAIRTADMDAAAGQVARLSPVRSVLVERQRGYRTDRGLVMEGRDIGTVVFPEAEVKIYLDAKPPERVRRRFEEMRAKGGAVPEGALAAQMEERDQRDSTRADAPLTQAPDAVYLDSTPLSIEEVEEAILRIVRVRVTNGKELN